MLFIGIDGASRRSGTPDCVSAGGIFIVDYDEQLEVQSTRTHSVSEEYSTSQRGELIALRQALRIVSETGRTDVIILTDSEYMFGTLTKRWYVNWINNGWKTSLDGDVKNQDLWNDIIELWIAVNEKEDITMVHTKGHCVPFGRVTANKKYDEDITGNKLWFAVNQKYTLVKADVRVAERLRHASALSKRNNGFEFDEEIQRRFVTVNMVADQVATIAVEEANRKFKARLNSDVKPNYKAFAA